MQPEVLKQPLHTTIAVDTLEFSEFNVEEKLHIVISVKDFKTIIAHAGITNTTFKALYSNPSSPMQLSYTDEGGLKSEFILMTIGESRGSSATPAPNPSWAASKRPASRQPLESTANARRALGSAMQPPGAPSVSRENPRHRVSRPPSSPPPESQSDALFVPRDDGDEQWDPMRYGDEDDHDDQDMLLWDQGDNASIIHSIQCNTLTVEQSGGTSSGPSLQSTEARTQARQPRHNADAELPPTQRVAPTQKMQDVSPSLRL